MVSFEESELLESVGFDGSILKAMWPVDALRARISSALANVSDAEEAVIAEIEAHPDFTRHIEAIKSFAIIVKNYAGLIRSETDPIYAETVKLVGEKIRRERLMSGPAIDSLMSQLRRLIEARLLSVTDEVSADGVSLEVVYGTTWYG